MSGSQDRKLVSHSSNCPKQEEGKGGEPKRSLVQTLPQSLFISPFELPVSSESQGEHDQTGTPSAGSGDSATDERQKVAVEGPGIALREKTSPTISCPQLASSDAGTHPPPTCR